MICRILSQVIITRNIQFIYRFISKSREELGQSGHRVSFLSGWFVLSQNTSQAALYKVQPEGCTL